nr:hypothetical protein [Tanacetum cinerariifolium]
MISGKATSPSTMTNMEIQSVHYEDVILAIQLIDPSETSNNLMLPIEIELLKGGVSRVHLLLGMIYLISGLKIQEAFTCSTHFAWTMLD